MSCDEMRDSMKQTTQDSHSMKEKTVPQKTVSSSFWEERHVGMREQMSKIHVGGQVS